eukprot:TRINITY_DN296_c0_g1_i6.p1 TRINITY_DN296_c0_g1~~TRINITY_DN296_c0_g1_i6.p1  ORF type:complete len:396 (+),score=90.25 TRINITY_DN296_c0_g1_i6:41-1228(+)
MPNQSQPSAQGQRATVSGAPAARSKAELLAQGCVSVVDRNFTEQARRTLCVSLEGSSSVLLSLTFVTVPDLPLQLSSLVPQPLRVPEFAGLIKPQVLQVEDEDGENNLVFLRPLTDYLLNDLGIRPKETTPTEGEACPLRSGLAVVRATFAALRRRFRCKPSLEQELVRTCLILPALSGGLCNKKAKPHVARWREQRRGPLLLEEEDEMLDQITRREPKAAGLPRDYQLPRVHQAADDVEQVGPHPDSSEPLPVEIHNDDCELLSVSHGPSPSPGLCLGGNTTFHETAVSTFRQFDLSTSPEEWALSTSYTTSWADAMDEEEEEQREKMQKGTPVFERPSKTLESDPASTIPLPLLPITAAVVFPQEAAADFTKSKKERAEKRCRTPKTKPTAVL